MSAATILVVEDEHLVAFDIQQCLSRMQYKPVVVYSGEAAVFAASHISIDLVVMDIKLRGGLDGIQAAEAIRKAHNTPVIYLTAYTDAKTLERARLTEPYGYVLKPFQERELMAVIEMALHRHLSEERRSAHARIEQFLADAGGRLAATLDLKSIAHDAVELIVPEYADVCAIHLSDGDDAISEIARAEGVDGRASPAAIRDIVERAEESRHPQMLELPSTVDSGTTNNGGPMLAVCVPLLTRGELLGAFAAGFRDGRTRRDGRDLSFIEDFARRLGVAVDNALLYRTSQRALTLRDNVLAVVSHDLRAPLSAIVLQAELLLDQPAAQHAAKGILHSAQLMTRIVGDLLDASAINAGKLTLDLGKHAVDEIINDAIVMFEAKAKAKGVTLSARVAEPVRVRCDRDRVLQVLANLLSNAIKATPRGGRVVLGAARDNGKIMIEVADTGSGIPEDEVARLFDRFWRAKGNREGAGLGLYIARGIVAAHGGSLGVATAVGEGSRFFFHLPEAR